MSSSRPSTPTRSPSQTSTKESPTNTGSTRSRLKSLRNSVHIHNPFTSSSNRNSVHIEEPTTPTKPKPDMATSPAGTPSKKLRRSLRARFTGHGRGTGRGQIEPLQDEKPAVILRVQVVGCEDLPAADANGKSDPYVVVTFVGKRFKTPVIQKNLNPLYNAKDATFDFPVYASVVEKIGSLVEFVVWDKDLIGKDYLGEAGLTASDWFKHNGGLTALAFTAPNNTNFTLPLNSSRKRDAKGRITLKLGFVNPPNLTPGSSDMGDAYAELTRRSRGGHSALLSAPPTQGIGTLGESGVVDAGAESDDDDGASDRTSMRSSLGPDDSLFRSRTVSTATLPPKKLPSFRLNWSGTKIDYSFSGHRDVAGIVLLEVKSARELPRQKTFVKAGGWDMDPFVVVSYGKKTFRTRVVRHSLDPVWGEKIMFHVRKADLESNNKIQISVLDWDKFASDDLVGDASIHIGELMSRVPPPDPATGLYREDMNLANGMAELELPLTVSKELADGKSSPVVVLSAKYEPHASFRQRFWRQNLHQFDHDKSRSFSFSEINAFLEDMGLSLDADTVYGFFPAHGKQALGDQLTLEETIQSLEEAIGMALEKGQRPSWAEDAAREVDQQAEKDKLESESLAASIQSALKERAESIKEEDEPPTPTTTAMTDSTTSISDADVDASAKASPPPATPDAEVENGNGVDASQPEPAPTPPIASAMPDTGASSDSTSPQRPPPQPQRASTFGRNRESIADLQGQLTDIFADHPDADLSDPDNPSIPARSLMDVLDDFSSAHGGLALFEPEEENALKEIIHMAPEAPITADILLSFLAQMTAQQQQPQPAEADHDDDDDGLVQDDEGDVTTRAPPSAFGAHSRSSSRSSVHTTRGGSERSSPERSNEPKTPKSGGAFDSRQRSTPMQPAPTSWKPQANYRRRRSSAGSQGRPSHISDNESSSNERGGPTRTRAPSNPTSPTPGQPVSFPGGRRSASRPVSPQRQNSNGHNQRARYGSQGQGMGDSGVLVPRPGDDHLDPVDLTAADLGHREDSDSEPDDDMEANLVRGRDSIASLASLAPYEKLESLQRANGELMRKLQESERALANKVMEHESELEELQAKLDEFTEELHSAKREEKELRGRERHTTAQLATLEGEIAKLQRQLETSRASYQSLQKQYQEQCAESEKYRNQLRRKDQDLKEAEENAQAHFGEMTKWKTAHEISEATIASLEKELQISRQAQATLHEQKQENLMLKETIDRLRFDLDELRSTKSSSVGGASGTASLAGTLSRSLANELKAQLGGDGDSDAGDANRSREEIVEEVEETERGSDDDYVETIIKRRKVVRRTTPGPAQSTEEIIKEYTDEATQHGPSDYSSTHSVQTEAPPVSAPKPSTSTSIQTEEPPRAPTPPPKREAPPPYHVLDDAEREAIGQAAIEKWHPGYAGRGVHGVSRDAVREWSNLKRELGFECAAIEQVVGEAPIVERPEEMQISDPDAGDDESVKSLASRLVNRVVGTCHRKLGLMSPAAWQYLLAVLCAFGGVCIISLILSSLLHPIWPNYVVPSYHDRIWWTSYNTLGVPGIDGMYKRSSSGPWPTFGALRRLFASLNFARIEPVRVPM
ncbi:hypothetical protein EXIGLDRAFT_115009 [Exidia glandulosa HHB12029]|uniref:C2 domain-containing protein n=1 Tax=Exidia glandulosa HHB12029 TaxID=1314781 RepID=A0A165GK28_EXIGL|nr:hypothetical protein EXIGLDRAFT_115009 [Exidia glandulosa HHB12029]